MKRQTVIVFILMCSIPIISCSKSGSESSALTVQSVLGDAKRVSNGNETALNSGDVLKAGEVVITGEKSIADIAIGQNGIIRINEKSSVTIDALIKDGATNTSLNISSGKAFVTISKLSKGEGFEIKTPTAIAAVRGTSFRVSADEESSQIDVVAGKVLVKPMKEGVVVSDSEVVVEKNSSVVLDTDTVKSIVEEKKPIEVVTTSQQAIEQIREETKTMEAPKAAEKELKEEMREVIAEPVVTAEPAKPVVEEKPKKDLAKEAKEQRAAEQKKLAEDRLKADKAAKEEQERIALEKAAADKAAAEKAAKEKQDTKEIRVKNIPTI